MIIIDAGDYVSLWRAEELGKTWVACGEGGSQSHAGARSINASLPTGRRPMSVGRRGPDAQPRQGIAIVDARLPLPHWAGCLQQVDVSIARPSTMPVPR